MREKVREEAPKWEERIKGVKEKGKNEKIK